MIFFLRKSFFQTKTCFNSDMLLPWGRMPHTDQKWIPKRWSKNPLDPSMKAELALTIYIYNNYYIHNIYNYHIKYQWYRLVHNDGLFLGRSRYNLPPICVLHLDLLVEKDNKGATLMSPQGDRFAAGHSFSFIFSKIANNKFYPWQKI